MRVGGEIRCDHVGGDREIHEQSAVLAVFRQHRDAGGHGIRRTSRPQLASFDQELAGLDRPHAEDGLADFGSAGSEQPGETDDLAVAQ